MAEKRTGLTVPAGILQPTTQLEDPPCGRRAGGAKEEGQDPKGSSRTTRKNKLTEKSSSGKVEGRKLYLPEDLYFRPGCWPTSVARSFHYNILIPEFIIRLKLLAGMDSQLLHAIQSRPLLEEVSLRALVAVAVEVVLLVAGEAELRDRDARVRNIDVNRPGGLRNVHVIAVVGIHHGLEHRLEDVRRVVDGDRLGVLPGIVEPEPEGGPPRHHVGIPLVIDPDRVVAEEAAINDVVAIEPARSEKERDAHRQPHGLRHREA